MDFHTTSGSTEQFAKIFFKSMSDEMQTCVQNCLLCSEVCEQTIQYCLDQGATYVDPRHIRLLQDCTEICRVSANFMMRDSNLHMQTCRTCALVCMACAANCERFQKDGVMQMCADICRQCADKCQKMSQRDYNIVIKEV